MSEELYCPRCVKRPLGDSLSLTDNETRICDSCANSEASYQRAKAKGASDFTLNLWGYEKEKWPVHSSISSSWYNITFKE